MGVLFALEIIALLIFLKLADFKRFRELLPITITGVYLRFLDHYILVDWLEVCRINGSKNTVLWLPLSADLTIWPIVSYLFVQYLPEKNNGLYTLLWVGLMFGYIQIIFWANIVTATDSWNPVFSAFFMLLFFTLLQQIWNWLRKPYEEKETSRN